MSETYSFQWQNPQLLKDIYPMRLQKLRDFLAYYREVDLWAEFKDKDISTLSGEVRHTTTAWTLRALQPLRNIPALKPIS